MVRQLLCTKKQRVQIGTLKALRFKSRKIRKIYIKQNNWITVISIILGLLLGFLLADYIFKVAVAKTYDMSAHIRLISYVYAIIGTLLVSEISSYMLAKKVNKIEW